MARCTISIDEVEKNSTMLFLSQAFGEVSLCTDGFYIGQSPDLLGVVPPSAGGRCVEVEVKGVVGGTGREAVCEEISEWRG